MNLLGKKVKAIKGLSVIILELHVHTGTVFFAPLPSGKLC